MKEGGRWKGKATDEMKEHINGHPHAQKIKELGEEYAIFGLTAELQAISAAGLSWKQEEGIEKFIGRGQIPQVTNRAVLKKNLEEAEGGYTAAWWANLATAFARMASKITSDKFKQDTANQLKEHYKELLTRPDLMANPLERFGWLIELLEASKGMTNDRAQRLK